MILAVGWLVHETLIAETETKTFNLETETRPRRDLG